MASNRGFTLIELMVTLSVSGILAAIAIPVFIESSARNQVWTASETIAAQVRQARLKAVSRNSSFQVRFNCPAAGQFRTLFVDATINNADRCTKTLANDSGVFVIPTSVGVGAAKSLEVSGLGVYTAIGGVVPQAITITDGRYSRVLTVTATGQVTFDY